MLDSVSVIVLLAIAVFFAWFSGFLAGTDDADDLRRYTFILAIISLAATLVVAVKYSVAIP